MVVKEIVVHAAEMTAAGKLLRAAASSNGTDETGPKKKEAVVYTFAGCDICTRTTSLCNEV
jgi:hypothetical protein